MLLSFSIENWMSFRDRVTFSMVATREKQSSDRVAYVEAHNVKVLPIAAIYGGNASGKSNFFKALGFAKKLVVQGTQPDELISVNVFQLDDYFIDQPAKFSFEILVCDDLYEYSFALTKKAIIQETLAMTSDKSRKKILFNRSNGESNLHKKLPNRKNLAFAFENTRENQLFINNSVSQNIDLFRPLYNWFKNSLILVSPDSYYEYEQFPEENHPFYSSISKVLSLLDTGVSKLDFVTSSLDNIPLPKNITEIFRENIKEGMINSSIPGYIITRKNGDLIVKKLHTYHAKTDGSDTQFEILEESDGTRRIIDLLPAFLELSAPNSEIVYIIDEIDRSLHTLLLRTLIETYLDKCNPNSRCQLVLTTHDVMLMDQNLLRRDEMWVTERDYVGNTKIYSFSDYKDVRYDKDIRKSYLNGRLGGVPNILLHSVMNITDKIKNK